MAPLKELNIIGDSNRVECGTAGTNPMPINIVGRNNEVHEIQINGERTVTINGYIVDIASDTQVTLDIYGEKLVLYNLKYTDAQEWAAREVSATSKSGNGNYEVKTNGIVVKISPPETETTLLDSFRMTKKEPGKLEIQMPS